MKTERETASSAAMVETTNYGGARGCFFPSISRCDVASRDTHSVAADLDGALLRSRDTFPYFFLLAVEAGSWPRGILLLLLYPLTLLLPLAATIRIFTFVTFAGLPMQDVAHTARTVLPRFLAADVRADAWRVFRRCGGRRVVATALPAAMVEPFVREFLGEDVGVIGAELQVDGETGRATGLVVGCGLPVGTRRKAAVQGAFAVDGFLPRLGLGSSVEDHHFLELCKEGYMVHPDPDVATVPLEDLNSVAIFHDGRFVHRPAPLHVLLVLLWIPIGSILSLLRISVFLTLPPRLARASLRLLGVRIVIRGLPLPQPSPASNGGGTAAPASRLFVLNHRNNLDPVFVCLSIGRKLPCVTYRLNRLFQLLSPIRTVALNRQHDADASRISALLRQGDVVMCPEGTTSREPYLLRFSALFAELSNNIVPVAIYTKQSLFHGTNFRGSKIMDPYFFFMNPRPTYVVSFMEPLPEEKTCKAGKTRIEVANHVQKVLGQKLGFKCTTLARKDKYVKLGGEEGCASPLPLESLKSD